MSTFDSPIVLDFKVLRRELADFNLVRTSWTTNAAAEKHFVLDVRYSGRPRSNEAISLLMADAVRAARRDGLTRSVLCVAHVTDARTGHTSELRFAATRVRRDTPPGGSDAGFAGVFQAFVHEHSPIR